MSGPDPFALIGLIGHPVAQSRSPSIHNFWLDRHGIAGRYVLLPLLPDRLDAALGGLAALGFRGCNVTMPHKRAVLPLLDHVDPVARRIGAINTVVVREDGTLGGFNSDAPGFLQSLRDAKPDWQPDAGPALVLGAGGAARAVVVALAEAGATEIRVANRTLERAESLAADLGGGIAVLPWDRRAAALAGAALVVNTTDRGMAGKPALDIALDRLDPAAVVADLIYSPLETPFLEAARARGNLTVNGLGMLLNQAQLSFAGWFGVMPEIGPALRATVAATFQPA